MHKIAKSVNWYSNASNILFTHYTSSLVIFSTFDAFCYMWHFVGHWLVHYTNKYALQVAFSYIFGIVQWFLVIFSTFGAGVTFGTPVTLSIITLITSYLLVQYWETASSGFGCMCLSWYHFPQTICVCISANIPSTGDCPCVRHVKTNKDIFEIFNHRVDKPIYFFHTKRGAAIPTAMSRQWCLSSVCDVHTPYSDG